MKQNYFITTTPPKLNTPYHNERMKRFMRRPDGSSERSSSKKSKDSNSLSDMYIKSPGSAKKRVHTKQQDFFSILAASILKTTQYSDKKNQGCDRYKGQKTERTSLTELDDIKQIKNKGNDQCQNSIQKLNIRICSLQAELDLKNHQASILSNQCQRLKKTVEEEKEKRRKMDGQRKQIMKQLRQVHKNAQNLKLQLKKLEKQKQNLTKQIEFLQRISYDDKTRSLQSYRQNYLQSEMQKMRKQLLKTREQRQNELQSQIKILKQEKFTMESHLKATKVANQCLIKQINNFQEGLQDMILNSQEYKKLRDKYVRFLEEYKLLRNQYWTLKAQIHKKKGGRCSSDQSQIFSITASEVENDLSQLRSSNQNSILQQLSSTQLSSHASRYI